MMPDYNKIGIAGLKGVTAKIFADGMDTVIKQSDRLFNYHSKRQSGRIRLTAD